MRVAQNPDTTPLCCASTRYQRRKPVNTCKHMRVTWRQYLTLQHFVNHNAASSKQLFYVSSLTGPDYLVKDGRPEREQKIE